MAFDMQVSQPHFKGNKKGRVYLTTHRVGSAVLAIYANLLLTIARVPVSNVTVCTLYSTIILCFTPPCILVLNIYIKLSKTIKKDAISFKMYLFDFRLYSLIKTTRTLCNHSVCLSTVCEK